MNVIWLNQDFPKFLMYVRNLRPLSNWFLAVELGARLFRIEIAQNFKDGGPRRAGWLQLATIFSPYSRRTAEPSKLDPVVLPMIVFRINTLLWVTITMVQGSRGVPLSVKAVVIGLISKTTDVFRSSLIERWGISVSFFLSFIFAWRLRCKWSARSTVVRRLDSTLA